MPSQKKSKAKKGAKKKEEGGQQQGQEAPEAQMERLKIADDSQADEVALLEKAIKLAAAEKEALETLRPLNKRSRTKKWQQNMMMNAYMDTSQLRIT
jgi:hypothetical protein